MALATEIRKQIKQLPEGKTFGYDDLHIAKNDYTTAAKALERLQKEGLIRPKSNTLTEDEKEFLNDLLDSYADSCIEKTLEASLVKRTIETIKTKLNHQLKNIPNGK